MQLIPIYDGPPPITVDGDVKDVLVPFVRQRTRLGQVLGSLTVEQWAAPSRCEGWSAQDVVNHLVVTNGFWELSIKAGLAGEPTRYLGSFDPQASPAEAAPAMRAWSPEETLAKLTATNQVLFDLLADLDDAGWATAAEAPAGHLPIRLVANHGLWDAWVHERDVTIPLGLTPAEEADEVRCCLRFAAALGPALRLSRRGAREGALVVEPTDGSGPLVVALADTVRVHEGEAPAGAARLTGPAVALAEGLSVRGPLDLTGVPQDQRWLVAGLAEVFARSDETAGQP